MTRNLKSAFFSALLVLAVAYPVFGLKLEIVGVNLAVIGASTTTGTDGGMMVPSEPPPQSVPATSLLS